ncbi:hypothetical protein AYI70_g4870 [Smittium culicis]|uniref:Uncharacterized protein n=1 Tax=Smittium culicis TaxID=133412 RepID=A0A1R1XXC6_9FUNG|nr:hypothetical protein AYI70_g8007 [Smittium culicis]OMJ19209.1 hypothetical protein AYI70_g4870 [Smittium culicis]
MENIALVVGRRSVDKAALINNVFGLEPLGDPYKLDLTSQSSLDLEYTPISWSHKTAYYQFKIQILIHETGKNDKFLAYPRDDQARLGNSTDSIVFVFDPFQPETFKEFLAWSQFSKESDIKLKLCVCSPSKPGSIFNKLSSSKLSKFETICNENGWEWVDLTKVYEPNSLSFPSTKLIVKPDQVDPDIGLNNFLHILLAFEQHFWSVMFSVLRYDLPGQAGLEEGIRVTPELLGQWLRNDAIAKMHFNIFGITAQRLASYLFCDGEVDYSIYDNDWERIISQFDEKDIFKLTDKLFPDVDSDVVQDPMESIENVIIRLKKIHSKIIQLPEVERRIEAAKTAVAYSSQMV